MKAKEKVYPRLRIGKACGAWHVVTVFSEREDKLTTEELLDTGLGYMYWFDARNKVFGFTPRMLYR